MFGFALVLGLVYFGLRQLTGQSVSLVNDGADLRVRRSIDTVTLPLSSVASATTKQQVVGHASAPILVLQMRNGRRRRFSDIKGSPFDRRAPKQSDLEPAVERLNQLIRGRCPDVPPPSI